MTREQRAEQWFDYIVANKKAHWCHGFTNIRLLAVKATVLANTDIMWDLLDRHSAALMSPEEMKRNSKSTFDHCIGNLSTSILYTMMDKGLIKK